MNETTYAFSLVAERRPLKVNRAIRQSVIERRKKGRTLHLFCVYYVSDPGLDNSCVSPLVSFTIYSSMWMKKELCDKPNIKYLTE